MDPEGARLFTYSTICYGKPRLCINLHHRAPPRTVLQQPGLLQFVQNAAARLVSGAGRYDHITPVLQELH